MFPAHVLYAGGPHANTAEPQRVPELFRRTLQACCVLELL